MRQAGDEKHTPFLVRGIDTCCSGTWSFKMCRTISDAEAAKTTVLLNNYAKAEVLDKYAEADLN